MASRIVGDALVRRQCIICSDPFDGKHNQKACTPRCGFIHDRNRARDYQREKRKDTPTLTYAPRNCRECESVFTPTIKTALYCSRKCSKKVTGRRFKRKIAASNRTARESKPRDCVHCGDSFTAATYQQAYCSTGCRDASDRKRVRERYTPRRDASKRRACIECGVNFVPRDARQAGCSLECGGVISARTGAHIRRVRLLGSFVERVDPFNVFERDKWKCQQCGVRTPKAQRGKHQPNSPELDHIIPVARGGEHSYRNTQCLCRRCNASKGVKPRGQLRLFG